MEDLQIPDVDSDVLADLQDTAVRLHERLRANLPLIRAILRTSEWRALQLVDAPPGDWTWFDIGLIGGLLARADDIAPGVLELRRRGDNESAGHYDKLLGKPLPAWQERDFQFFSEILRAAD